jgi:hypothetical protein
MPAITPFCPITTSEDPKQDCSGIMPQVFKYGHATIHGDIVTVESPEPLTALYQLDPNIKLQWEHSSSLVPMTMSSTLKININTTSKCSLS